MSLIEQIEKLTTDWKNVLLQNKQLTKIEDFIASKDPGTISPPIEDIFNAFNHFDVTDLRLVIMAQDPYPGKGDANGIAFSINPDRKIPASLKNIYKELEKEGFAPKKDGDLTFWAEQGVLLLNAALTLENNKSNSHAKEWKKFTDEVIEWISDNTDDVTFLLLGGFAQNKCKKVDEDKHNILKCVHPSPLSVNKGFAGSDIFIKVNNIVKGEPIKW